MNLRREFTDLWHHAMPAAGSGGIAYSRLIMLAALGLVLVAAGNFLAHPSRSGSAPQAVPAPAAVPPNPTGGYEEQLEAKLTAILAQVKGAGAVAVNVTLESGPNKEYAKNVVKESKTIQEKDSTGGTRTTTEARETEQLTLSKESGADRPVLVREARPVVKGVLVVAAGAADSRVKAELTRAVETVLGIPAYRITVLPQKGR